MMLATECPTPPVSHVPPHSFEPDTSDPRIVNRVLGVALPEVGAVVMSNLRLKGLGWTRSAVNRKGEVMAECEGLDKLSNAICEVLSESKETDTTKIACAVEHIKNCDYGQGF